jgi:hypothetical protein
MSPCRRVPWLAALLGATAALSSLNENKTSYRWQERALIATKLLKPRKAGTLSGQRLAASPGEVFGG